MSPVTRTGSEEDGTLAKKEIMRWVLEGVGDKGVTVRLCVTRGSITFYVSQYVTPSEELNENQSTITSTKTRVKDCSTIFKRQHLRHVIVTQEHHRQVESSTLYLSIEGHDTLNTFILQSGNGNVTFGECNCSTLYHTNLSETNVG